MVNKTVYFLIDCSEQMRVSVREINELLNGVTNKILSELDKRTGDIRCYYAVYGVSESWHGGVCKLMPKRPVGESRKIILTEDNFRGKADMRAVINGIYRDYHINAKAASYSDGVTEAPPLIVAFSNGLNMGATQRDMLAKMLGSAERMEAQLKKLSLYIITPNGDSKPVMRKMESAYDRNTIFAVIRKSVLEYAQPGVTRAVNGIFVNTLRPNGEDKRAAEERPVRSGQPVKSEQTVRSGQPVKSEQTDRNGQPDRNGQTVKSSGGATTRPQFKDPNTEYRAFRPGETVNKTDTVKAADAVKPADTVKPAEVRPEEGAHGEERKENAAANTADNHTGNTASADAVVPGERPEEKPAESPADNAVNSGAAQEIVSELLGETAASDAEEETGEAEVYQGKTVEDMSFTEARGIAYLVAEFFAKSVDAGDDYKQALRGMKAAVPELTHFEVRMVAPVIDCLDKPNGAQKNNVAVACALFFALSKGKYVQEVWSQAARKKENTPLGAARAEGKRFADACRKDFGDKFGDEIGKTVERIRLNTEREDIRQLLERDEAVGIAKLYEMLWEVFTDKYCNYTASLWQKKIGEFKVKHYAVREGCEFKFKASGFEIYGVSYEGKLDKPSHAACEDCSFVAFYDDKTFLAVEADGVGSCINSSLGSLLATNCLYDVIADCLNDYNVIRVRRKFLNNPTDWAGLMNYFKRELAVDFYRRWEENIKITDDYLRANSPEMNQFTTTLQFVFCCEEFIACGRLGDGTFFLRKCEKVGGNPLYGGMLLNDGISGVTQSAVMTVAHLKGNPAAMVINFFSPREVTDVVISSDGVTCALGESVSELNSFVNKVDAMPFDERCKYLAKVARMASDYNTTQKGSGDDSTLIHVRLNVPDELPAHRGSEDE